MLRNCLRFAMFAMRASEIGDGRWVTERRCPVFKSRKFWHRGAEKVWVFETSKIEHPFPDFMSSKLTATVARRFDVMSESPRAVFWEVENLSLAVEWDC